MPDLKSRSAVQRVITPAGLEALITAERKRQGTPYIVLTRPGGLPEKDYAIPTSGGNFEESMQTLSELLEIRGVRLPKARQHAWAGVFGSGPNYDEIDHVLKIMPGLERVFVVEAQRVCINSIIRDWAPKQDSKTLGKIVFVNGDACNLRWVMPDRSLTLGFLNHIVDTVTLSTNEQKQICSEVARTLTQDGIIIAMDGHSKLMKEEFEKNGVEALAYVEGGCYAGSPNPSALR